jgi:Domain of unknown function (DUF4440)
LYTIRTQKKKRRGDVVDSVSEERWTGGLMQMETDQQQILKLFEDGDRALIAADLAELSRIFSEEYIQYDETGRPSTKQEVLNNLKSGAIRYISMISKGRRIRLLREGVAIVHGSEEDEVEQAGKRFPIRYVYMDAVVKRNGKWQIVASQLAKLSS